MAASASAFAGEADDDEMIMRGGGVYQSNCAACHGTAGLGGVGYGHERGPALRGVPLAYLDQTLRTGRMPIADKRLGVLKERLTDDERQALLAYAADQLDATGELPTVGPGRAARGQSAYVRNCAACHGATAMGGIVGGGSTAPALTTTDPLAVAEAIRVGPFEMPAFAPEALDDQQVDDIIAYLQQIQDTPRTPAGLREVNDVVAAAAAMALAATVLVVLGRVGRRHDGGKRKPRAWT